MACFVYNLHLLAAVSRPSGIVVRYPILYLNRFVAMGAFPFLLGKLLSLFFWRHGPLRIALVRWNGALP